MTWLNMTPTQTKIYNEAKACLGKHITLNNAVPAEVGCAESVSYVLKNAGIIVPAEGIASTVALDAWLASNPTFEKKVSPEEGAVGIAVTGTGNGLVEGHAAIVGGFGVQFPGDFGFMSNNSDSGLFLELWKWESFNLYYGQVGQLTINFYTAK